MANFEYIDQVEAAAEKEEIGNKFSVTSSESKTYWEELLKDRYQEHKVDEGDALGKRKRKRNKFPVCRWCLVIQVLLIYNRNRFVSSRL